MKNNPALKFINCDDRSFSSKKKKILDIIYKRGKNLAQLNAE